MPPTQTPSARHVKKPSTQARSRAQLSSAVRLAGPSAPSSTQFAQTPRFNFSSSARQPGTRAPSSSSPLATRGKLFQSPRLQDDIDELEEPHLLGQNVHNSVEDEAEDAADEMLLDLDEDQVVPKRRYPSSSSTAPPTPSRGQPARKRQQAEPIRLSSSPVLYHDDGEVSNDEVQELRPQMGPPMVPSISATPRAQRQEPPQTPAHRTTTAPRFRFTPTITEPAAGSKESTRLTPRQPQFILPAQADLQPTAAMLPLLFSPQRRGQKYLSGGLAETVRDWVLEAGGQMQTREVWKIQVQQVESVGPGGAMMVRGQTMNGEEVSQAETRNMLLVGGDIGPRQHDICVGDVLTAREGWSFELRGDQETNGERTGRRWQVIWGSL